MSKENQTISCVLLNYNHAAYLPRALDGAINQTVPFDEIIVIDDGSTDGSVAVIERRIQHVSNARLVRNPGNLGVIPTINIGVKEAAGDFVFFMSADDEYSPQLVEWCRNLLQQHPDLAIVCGNALIRRADTGKETHGVLPFPQNFAAYPGKHLAKIGARRALTFLGGPGFIRREAIIQAGGYKPELRWHTDWFLCLIVCLRHGFGYIPKPLVTFRIADSQYSHGRHDWRQQKPVIEAFMKLLQNEYAGEYEFFRRHAVLPAYDPQTLILLLRDSDFRHYLTPLLIWRLMTYKPLRAAATVLPDGLRAKMRGWLRV